MRQTAHWKGDEPLIPEKFDEVLRNAVSNLDVNQACKGVELFGNTCPWLLKLIAYPVTLPWPAGKRRFG